MPVNTLTGQLIWIGVQRYRYNTGICFWNDTKLSKLEHDHHANDCWFGENVSNI